MHYPLIFYSIWKTYIADDKKNLRHHYNMVERHLYFFRFSFFYFFYLLLLCHLMASPTSLDTCKGILDWILFYPEMLSNQLSFFGFFSLCVNATWLKQFFLNLQWIEIFKLDNCICEGKASFLDVKKIKLKFPTKLLKDNCKTTFSKWSLIPCLTFLFKKCFPWKESKRNFL